MRTILRDIGRGFYNLFIAITIVAFLGGTLALANYAVTQGSGTNFGSVVVSSVHYAQQLLCDLTTPSQCAAVNSSGQIAIQAPPTLPLPAGGATSSNQSSQITQETATAGALGTTADTAYSGSGSGTIVSILKWIGATLNSILTAVQASIPAGTNNIGNVGVTSQYPAGATAVTASATGTTAATTATLAGTSGKTTYICGYSIRANATAATTVTDTITGTITATLSSILWVAPLASGIGVDEQIFSPCIPASGTNQAIAIVSGAPGSGGTVSSKGWGYQL
jgi:hypothetical protein